MGRLVVITPDEGEPSREPEPEPEPEPERAPRDSVFLQASISLGDGTESHMFRIRNISSHGLMAEGPIGFVEGCALVVDLRNVGSICGHVTWARANRFGFRFDHPIDPKAVRIPLDGKAR